MIWPPSPLVVVLVGLLVGWGAWLYWQQPETWVVVGLFTIYYWIWARRGWPKD